MVMLSRRRLFALVIASVAAVPAAGIAAAGDAGGFIDRLGTEAIKALAAPELSREDRETRFRDLLDEFFDLPGIGKFVLARYWKVASEEERAEFLGLFETLIVRSYAQRFDEYSGENFHVVEVAPAGQPNYTLVRSLVDRSEGEPIRVDWLVLDKGGVEKIEDVKIEGISMAQTYRSEFAAVIQSSGGKVAGLNDTLRQKIGSLGEQNAAQ